MAPALSGCLDPTPEYTVPDPVPPVIIVDQVVPQVAALVSISDPSFTFTVPFRADDSEEPFVAYFFHDTPQGKPPFSVVDSGPIPALPDPRPFAEQMDPNRDPVHFTWPWLGDQKVAFGCHTLTMILSHQSNFDTSRGFIDVRDRLAAAQITWFLALADPTDPTKTPDCGDWPNVSTGSTR